MGRLFVLLGLFCTGIAQAHMIAQVGWARSSAGYFDRTELRTRYFLSPVDTGKGPLSLAAFLGRADEIGLEYDKQTGYYSNAQNGETYRFNGLYIRKDSGWFVSGSGGRSTSQYEPDRLTVLPGYVVDFNRHLFRMSVGKYLFNTTTVALGVGRDSTKAAFRSTIYIYGAASPYTVISRSDVDIREVYLTLRHFGRLRGAGYELTGTCSRIDTQSIDWATDSSERGPVAHSDSRSSRCTLGAYLFPENTLRVGAFYRQDNEAPVFETSGVDVEWFPAPSLAVRFSYARHSLRYVFTLESIQAVQPVLPFPPNPGPYPRTGPTLPPIPLFVGPSELSYNYDMLTIGVSVRF